MYNLKNQNLYCYDNKKNTISLYKLYQLYHDILNHVGEIGSVFPCQKKRVRLYKRHHGDQVHIFQTIMSSKRGKLLKPRFQKTATSTDQPTATVAAVR